MAGNGVMLRTWLPWILSAALLTAAAFVAGLVLGGQSGEGNGASLVLPEADQEMLATVERLRRERDAIRQERDAVAKRVAALRQDRDVARERGDRLRQARDDARSRIATLEDELAAARQRVTRAEGALERVGVQLDVLEARLSAAESRAETAEAEAAALREVRRSVRASACRALAESMPEPARLPKPEPAADAFSEAQPSDARRMDLAKGVLAYECTEYASAYRLWLPLAQAGYPRAQFHTGALFYEGRGVRRDDALAFAWLTLAARHGSEAANALLDGLRRRMDQAATQRGRRLLSRAG